MMSASQGAQVAILGGRGAGVLAAFTLARAVAPQPTPLLGFLNDVEVPGELVEGIEVLGPFELWSSLDASPQFLAPLHKVKEMRQRAQRIRSLAVPDARWINVIDPTAIIAPGTLIGSGIWAQAGSMVMPGARVGRHVALRSGCHISHDCTIGDFVNVGLGSIVCGYSIVREGAYIAAASVVRDGITVGAYSVVGMGAVVVDNVPDDTVVVGNPAQVVGRLKDISC